MGQDFSAWTGRIETTTDPLGLVWAESVAPGPRRLPGSLDGVEVVLQARGTHCKADWPAGAMPG